MEKSKRYVLIEAFSLKDIFGFLIFFSILLILLFPAGRLEELILTRKEMNVELTEKYIEALLRLRLPQDIKEALLRKYILEGDEEKVEKLLAKLKEDNPERAYELEYLYLKRKFFETAEEKEKVIKKLKGVLTVLVLNTQDPLRLEQLYRDALSFNFSEIAYRISLKLAKLTGKKKWYEEALILAWRKGDYPEAGKLLKKFNPSRKESLLIAYLYYRKKGNYREALKYLEKYINSSGDRSFKKDLILLYLITGKYEKAYGILREVKGTKLEKALIKAVLRELLWLRAYKSLKKFIKDYALTVEGDREYYRFLLKLALETGDPYFASEIAIRIAKELGVLR